jgi:uncharacterized protein (DUF1697 family)
MTTFVALLRAVNVGGKREIYIHYGSGMARSKLRIPAAAAGTARNMNTIAKLAELGTKCQ